MGGGASAKKVDANGNVDNRVDRCARESLRI